MRTVEERGAQAVRGSLDDMASLTIRLNGKPFTLDIGKAQRELGYRPIVSWEQGLKAMQGR